MGIFHSQNAEPLSEGTLEFCRSLYSAIDIDQSNGIDINEAMLWWKSNFAIINARAMFEAVDANHDGVITLQEWIGFWTMVKEKGHSEEEILEELNNISKKFSWVQMEGVPALSPRVKD